MRARFSTSFEPSHPRSMESNYIVPVMASGSVSLLGYDLEHEIGKGTPSRFVSNVIDYHIYDKTRTENSS